MLSIFIEFNIWAKIELLMKVLIIQHIGYNNLRVAIPNFVLGLHPVWCTGIDIFWDFHCHALPGNIAKLR
jgi:hypothetical protein